MKPYSERGNNGLLSSINCPDCDLDYFFQNAYHDMRFFLKSTTEGSSSIYTYFGDAQKGLYYISNNLKEIFGFESNIVENLPSVWEECIYGERWRELYKKDRQNVLKDKKEIHDLRYQVKSRNGEIFWIHCTSHILWDETKTKPLFIAGRIIKQSDEFAVDPLTKVPLVTGLKHRLGILKKYDYSCKVIGVSLNHISQINLQYGRNVGDTIIKRIVKNSLTALVGKLTTFSISGTKYIAIVDNEYVDEVNIIIQEIAAIANEVYYNLGIKIDCPCSFAVMNYNFEEDNPNDFIENMISLIKLSGNNIYGDCIDNSKIYLDQIHEDARMTLALNKDVFNLMNNFTFNVQPIVSPYENKILGGECLMSWEYEGKRVSPAQFIPLLEKNSRLITIAGKWIIKSAIVLSKKIIKQYPDFYLTVNISRKQLQEEEFFEYIPRLLKKENYDGKNLVFEITESVIDKDPKRTHRLFELCRKLGIRLAIDDFGTGYSSFRALMQYEYDILKIDRTLLLELEKSEQNLDYIIGLASACHKNKIKICVEGVETENQKQLATSIPCDVIQGYYYFRPMDASSILKVIEKDKLI